LPGSGSTSGSSGQSLFFSSIAPRLTDRLYNEPSIINVMPLGGSTSSGSVAGTNSSEASPMPSVSDRNESQASDIESIDRAFRDLDKDLMPNW
jgi:hypothetical protein